MRHLNNALTIYLLVTAVMIVVSGLTVRYVLWRKQKRKHRGRSHEIDMFRRRPGDES